MQKLWGGRFEGSTDALVDRLNNSLRFDGRLWKHDIRGSVAHARMLGATSILPQPEAERIIDGLNEIASDLEAERAELPNDAEDIHTAIEMMLRDRIGPAAGKLHTARSRNDQVATDLRLWTLDAIDAVCADLADFQGALIRIAESHTETVMPGFTHLQHAQPIVLAHHLMAYFWMLQRDHDRLASARHRTNQLPLGACAMAGTSFPIDRAMVAAELGFEGVIENSMDAVSDRDFVIEFLAAASILSIHISRLAEELILWSGTEYGFVTLHDSVTTGSSIMPQKKNPDVAELARGKAGRVVGSLVNLLIVTKGLPLTYNKDLQEDKEPLFDAVDTLRLIMPAMVRTVETAEFHVERMEAATRRDFSTATDVADYLARTGLPFREAHGHVGRLTRGCIERGIGLEDLTTELTAELAPELALHAEAIARVTGVAESVRSRRSRGGGGPEAIAYQLDAARKALAAQAH